ncbi:MAG: NAD-dependent epimerase/dehydratase family protein [Alphaproteobacteria bacterium]|nr:NAD-dependent epimerase/dehydratase family protein [Alphaproteobacteria bacterium]
MDDRTPAPCVVLGGCGFIGANLTAALAQAGHEVRCFDRFDPPAWAAPAQDVRFIKGDAEEPERLEQAMRGAEICFHLMSTTIPKTSNDDPIYDATSNLVSSLRVLESCRAHGVRKIIFLSSGGTVYGQARYTPIDERHPTHPLCAYGVTRLTIEKYLHMYHALHGLDYCVLRAANPYGPGQNPRSAQGAIGVFLGRMLNGETIDIWGDGSVVRDFLYIQDLVRALMLAIDHQGPTRLFNIGSGAGCRLNTLLDELAQATGRRPRTRRHPARAFDAPVNVLDISAARAGLNWAPTISLPTGLRLTWEWLRARNLNREDGP